VILELGSGSTLEAEVLLVAVGRETGHRQHGLRRKRNRTRARFSSAPTKGLRTTVPNEYAVGDVVAGLQLAHRGFQQGIFVAEEIAGLRPAPIVRSRYPPRHLLASGGRLGGPDRGPRA